MAQQASSLAELVSALHDGVAFYERAAAKVTDPAFVDLFARMAALKRRIAGDLNVELTLRGERPRDEGSLLGAVRILYAEAIAGLTDRSVATYVARLEEQEDRLLHAFREAVLAGDSASVRDMALLYYPEVEKMHADMSRLKKMLT